MTKPIYPKGVRVFNPRNGAPDFAKGSLVITPNELHSWLKENPDLISEYKGEKQIKLNLLEGRDGLYLTVDTYKKNQASQDDETPFP